VHGILVSSLFSTLFGRSIPGAVYVSQSVRFRRPVHVGAQVLARMQITNIEQRRKGVLLTCATTCSLIEDKEEGEGEGKLTVAVEGEAQVLLMMPTSASE
jgi:3-hydroxybutyryl-CoA dehydratase